MAASVVILDKFFGEYDNLYQDDDTVLVFEDFTTKMQGIPSGDSFSFTVATGDITVYLEGNIIFTSNILNYFKL